MNPKGHARNKEERTVRTTIDLPEHLWRDAKVRAVEEHSDLRRVIIAALETHLKTKKRGA